MKSLRLKLTASFLSMTIITVTLIAFYANVILVNQFNEYVMNNLNEKTRKIVASLESNYNTSKKAWDTSGIERIGMGALGDGIIIRVSAFDDTILWDAMTHNSGMCAALLQHMAANMERQAPGFQGGYIEKSHPVIINSETVGTIAIGYYGPYFYTDNDISFLNTLNKLLILVAGIAGSISILLGTYLAKRLSAPIARVIKTAEQISKGNYADRATEQSNTREIVELTDTINALAQTLGKQESLRKRLTADVAHELRTPIANLQGHLEAMIDGIWQPDTKRLKSCHDEVIRLSTIVSDLQMLDRNDGEHVVLKKERFDVSKVILKAVLGFETELRMKNIHLETACSEQFLMADRDKIIQIVVNILSNAIKYTETNGIIQISVGGAHNEVRISIKDNGIGIAAEDLPYIFERFYRVDQSRSRSTGGSGIGLAIAKSLTQAHGGTIHVNSEPGLGSEFIIIFPTSQNNSDKA